MIDTFGKSTEIRYDEKSLEFLVFLHNPSF